MHKYIYLNNETLTSFFFHELVVLRRFTQDDVVTESGSSCKIDRKAL